MKRKYLYLVLIIPILILYFNSFQYDFIAIDDGGQVLENTKLHRLSFGNLIEIFSSATVGMYQPLTSLCFAFIIALFGFKTAFTFHIFSFLLHVINTCLIYFLGKNILHQKINPFLLPLLFALHPLAVESVAWVSATSTLLFTCFFLLATLQYLKYLKTDSQKSYVLCLFFFTLGLISKAQMLPFVGVLFLMDYLKDKPLFNRRQLLQKIPFIIIAAIFVVITLHFRGDQFGVSHNNFNPNYLIPVQFVWYVYKTFLPLNLGIVYDWPTEILTIKFLFSCLFLLGFLLLFYKKRKNKLFVFGALFYLFNIVLHTSLFSSFLGPFADRYAYLSSLGIWFMLISLMTTKKSFEFNLIGFIFVGLLFFAAHFQLKNWENTVKLWSNNLKHQKSTFSNGMRGALYYEQKKYKLASVDFEKVVNKPDLRFEPEKYGYIYTALGMMTTSTNLQQSSQYFLKAAQYSPSLESFENVAIAYQKENNYKKAEEFYIKCLETSEEARFYIRLASLYYTTKEYQKGIRYLSKGINNGIENPMFYKMRCYFYLEEKAYNEAQKDYNKVSLLLGDKAITDNDLMSLKIKLQNKSTIKE
jgi:hypothetical protein